MKLKSPSFKDKEEIPIRFTGEGGDLSPTLEWSGVPDKTRSFALICEDLDAPKGIFKDYPFVHWIAYNIPATVTYLPEGVLPVQHVDLPVAVDQALNSFAEPGYRGPMPPEGDSPHRYIFMLYALNTVLGMNEVKNRKDLYQAIEGHVIIAASLIGEFQRVIKAKSA